MIRGIITIVIDDGYTSTFDTVVPLLDHYHFPAVFAVPLDHDIVHQATGHATTPWEQWLPLRDRGHEIAAHSISHADLSTLPPEKIEQEVRVPHERLQATTLVYPGGGYSATVLAITKKYYTAGRTIDHDFETLPPPDPFTLRTYDFTRNNFSLAKANILALRALFTNSWLIETYHIIDDNEQEMTHAVPLKQFSTHLAFLNRLPIAVKTIHQVISAKT